MYVYSFLTYSRPHLVFTNYIWCPRFNCLGNHLCRRWRSEGKQTLEYVFVISLSSKRTIQLLSASAIRYSIISIYHRVDQKKTKKSGHVCYLVRVRSFSLSHTHSLTHIYTLFLYFVLQGADLGNVHMLNTKVNGAFLVDTLTDLSKVREIHTASFARFAEIGDFYSPYVVTLDTSDGKRLGVKLMENPATGAGAAIKSVDSGGQAESTGKVYVGQVITHVNGTDVTEMAFKEITSLIEDSITIVFRLASVPVKASKEEVDEGLDDTSSCCCSQKTSVGQTKEEGSMIVVANRNFEDFEVRKTDVISNVSTILDPNKHTRTNISMEANMIANT